MYWQPAFWNHVVLSNRQDGFVRVHIQYIKQTGGGEMTVWTVLHHCPGEKSQPSYLSKRTFLPFAAVVLWATVYWSAMAKVFGQQELPPWTSCIILLETTNY